MTRIRTLFNWGAAFLRHDPVLTVALLLGIVSSFIVPPSAAYLGYIDFHVLALLFSLMLVVAGLQKCGALPC